MSTAEERFRAAAASEKPAGLSVKHYVFGAAIAGAIGCAAIIYAIQDRKPELQAAAAKTRQVTEEQRITVNPPDDAPQTAAASVEERKNPEPPPAKKETLDEIRARESLEIAMAQLQNKLVEALPDYCPDRVKKEYATLIAERMQKPETARTGDGGISYLRRMFHPEGKASSDARYILWGEYGMEGFGARVKAFKEGIQAKGGVAPEFKIIVAEELLPLLRKYPRWQNLTDYLVACDYGTQGNQLSAFYQKKDPEWMGEPSAIDEGPADGRKKMRESQLRFEGMRQRHQMTKPPE